VSAIRDGLQRIGHEVWWDCELRPGEAFDVQIRNQLQAADVFVSFLSKYSASGVRSPQEIILAASLGKPTLYVLIDEVDLTTMPTPVKFGVLLHAVGKVNANEVADLIDAKLPTLIKPPASAEPKNLLGSLVEQLASEARNEVDAAAPREQLPKAVFIVHGHDDAMMNDVTAFISAEGLEPIVLKKVRGGQNTLFDKFRTVGSDAKFAVVLISADDFGAAVDEYNEDGAGERALLYRARQNVILETGFFFGRLGWDNVFVLMKPPPRKVPRFERPSDLEGVIFETYDRSGEWKDFLRDQLRARKLI
jgi:predicted nucleotide-binding protein